MQTFRFTLPEGGSYKTEITLTPDGKHYVTIVVSEGELLEEIFRRTIKAGLMTQDCRWADGTTMAQIAIWVSLCSERINSPTRWSWAEKRWGLSKLNREYDKVLNRTCFSTLLEKIKRDCFGDGGL